MNGSPVISVIVPVYKVEPYLPECLDSILAQTFDDFELLLIDDGSPDRSGAICEGQHVFISDFNHGYDDRSTDSNEQPLVKKTVVIDEDSYIGANNVVVAGIHIGERCQIGAGSIVAKDVPDYSVAVGNSARIIKRYDINKQKWIRN